MTHVSFFHFAENTGSPTTSTSSSYTEHLSTSFVAEAGVYYSIYWYAEFYSGTNSTWTRVRIQQDDTTTLANPSQDILFVNSVYHSINGFIRTTLSAGTRQIDMDFANYNGTTEVRLRRGRILIFKEHA